MEVIFQSIGSAPLYPDLNNRTYEKSFTDNPDVFSVISKISQPCARVPIYMVDADDNEVTDAKKLAPLRLLQNPNPFESQEEFIEKLIVYYEVFGNAYIGGHEPGLGLTPKVPGRLDVLPSPWTYIVSGDFYEPIKGYQLFLSDRQVDYQLSEVLHWKTVNIDTSNPVQMFYGMSPLKALLKSVTASSSGYDAMVKTFQNMGAYGLLSLLGESYSPDGKNPVDLLNQKWQEKYSGTKNNGRLVIASQDHKYTNFGLSLVDMNLLQLLGVTKGTLGDAYGVPGPLLNGSIDRTYQNYRESEKILYIDVIIPTLDAILSKLSTWLMPKYGLEGYKFKADYSVIDCLKADIALIVNAMSTAGVFTKNEIRQAVDFEPIEDPVMDEVWTGISQQPLSSMGMDNNIDNTLKALKWKDYRYAKVEN